MAAIEYDDGEGECGTDIREHEEMIKKPRKIDKKAVGRLLVSLQSIDAHANGCVMDDGDTLDVNAFNMLSQVKEVKEKLKEMGIDKKWLWDNGFMAAGLLLTWREDNGN